MRRSSDSDRPDICFVAHSAYGALCGGARGCVGGVEKQTSLMARWLVGRGYRVSMLTWDEGQADGEVRDGVRALTICRRNAGLRGVRFFHPKWTHLVGAMRRGDADVYYFNSAECSTGQVAWWCRRHNRRFVYSVASDPACDARLPLLRTIRERVLYRYGVRHADRIIVQTDRQRQMLSGGFGVEAVVLPMPCPDPLAEDDSPPQGPGPDRPTVVWVGRIAKMKRLELLLDVAERMPEVSFAVVGPDADGEYAGGLHRRAEVLANVTLHGRAAPRQMPSFYRQAAALCCTSAYEGLPNTFLEAWSHGLPVASTFDPGDLIATHELGVLASDAAGLAAGLRELIGRPQVWQRISRNARQYYLRNHAVEVAMPRFERVFLDVWRRQ